MGYNVFNYLVSEGFKNVFKNKKSTVAALCIMCATMIVFGIFFAITENINNMISELEKSQGIEVFIKNDATETDIAEIGEKIKSLEGVNTVQYIDEEEAVNRVRDYFNYQEELLVGLDGVLPVSYIVTFTDLAYNSQVQQEISTWDHIDSITNKDDTTNTLMSIGKSIRIVSVVILVFLVIVSLFIISNTIKLTVHARRKEISIMKYVGATNGFIRFPFIVEGVIIGLIAAIISLLIVGGGYNMIADKVMSSALIEKLGFVAVNFTEMISLIIIVYLILGIGIGVIGSSISMKKYLDV